VTGNPRQLAQQLADRCEGDRLRRLESHEAHASGRLSIAKDLDQESGFARAGFSGYEGGGGRAIGACALTKCGKRLELVQAADKRRTH